MLKLLHLRYTYLFSKFSHSECSTTHDELIKAPVSFGILFSHMDTIQQIPTQTFIQPEALYNDCQSHIGDVIACRQIVGSTATANVQRIVVVSHKHSLARKGSFSSQCGRHQRITFKVRA